jgi:hypothetical protein
VNKLVYFKVFVLLAALGGVIYIITHLTPAKVSEGMAQAGLSEPAQAGAEKINLCRTRVHAIVWPDGRKIQEARDGLKARWQAYNLNPEDIGSMDVEKWLSLHCEVPGVARDASLPTKAFVTIEYIDGGRENLDRADDGVYRFAGRTFVSPELDKAFEDLIKLANLEPLGP